MRRSAHIDPSGRYRYSLRRIWASEAPRLCCVMLNPSTADATTDDPTLRRVMGFARRWGFGGVEVVNLYGLRSRDPRALREATDPVGPGNPAAQRRALGRAGAVLLAWGRPGGRTEARAAFLRRLRSVQAQRPELEVGVLAWTREREPVHPLYQPAERTLSPWGESGG